MDLIVSNGTIVTATDTYRADLGIDGGRIIQIGAALDPRSAARVLDATDRLVLPAGVDVHTHFDTKSGPTTTRDDYRTGTLAAACGGTTTIINFLRQEKGQTFADVIDHYHARARGQAAIDYGFHVVVADASKGSLAELGSLPGRGITSFKVYMAYKGVLMIDDETMLGVLEAARRDGALVMVHAENGDAASFLQQRYLAAGKTEPKYHAASRPPRLEAEATARAITLAETVGAPVYFVHVSCAEAIEEIERGRARGIEVYAETCGHYLHFTEADLDRPNFEGAKWVYTPPARAEQQVSAVWRALANGSLQVVSSDHCPYDFVGQKDIGRDDFTRIPNGAPGVEERLLAVYQGVVDGRIGANRFVELVSTQPAKLFGLYPRKGTIAVGSDADLVLWDPRLEWTVTSSALHHAVDYTLYEGRRVRGAAETVTLRGRVIVDKRRYVGRAGDGEFIARERFAARPGAGARLGVGEEDASKGLRP
ncbi:MAG: dihydropyrimidinase [Chloroflexota bacterium]|nr:dihydropyrimidinase [Chloroflexota bacterium]